MTLIYPPSLLTFAEESVNSIQPKFVQFATKYSHKNEKRRLLLSIISSWEFTQNAKWQRVKIIEGLKNLPANDLATLTR